MRIGIDARELGGRVTGVGRYLGGLVREWAQEASSRPHGFVLYAAEPLAIPLDAHRFPARLVPGSPGTWWEQVRLPRIVARDHLDVFFAPAYTAPLHLQAPIVVNIHDVSFLAHPEWYRTREGIRRRWLTRRIAERARAVITVSEFSRHELIEQLDVPDERIHVIPNAITPPLVARPRARAAERADPCVLFVGSVFTRRHVPELIRGFARLARRRADVSLDLVGDNRAYPPEDLHRTIRAETMEGRVRWHRYVPEEELGELYGRARAFAFLSEYEGFGLTPVEALSAGIPPVLLDTAVARETCGDAALYVASTDPIAISRTLEQALFDEPTRARILQAAPAVLSRYTWPRVARETLRVIERAVEG
jgi:glycosyltransferase involved in cell wall biosynthesis